MANTLALYDPLFYANEAIIALRKKLGMAARVHRGYDKAPQQKGSTIMINAPANFNVTDVNPSTGGTTQDVNPGQTSIVLNKWKEVKFGLTDKELTFTTEKIITDHIEPAAYALANQIDLDLNALVTDVPWIYPSSNPLNVTDITNVRKMLFDNGVDVNGDNLFWELDSQAEAWLLANSAFTQNQGAGQAGVEAQLSGFLGRRYNFGFFANQNTPLIPMGGDADMTGVAGAAAKGATTLTITGLGASAVVKIGDVINVAGHSQQYVSMENKTASTGTITSLQIATNNPSVSGLQIATSGSEVVTITGAGTAPATKANNVAFHRNAFALAMAPLSTMGNELGARIETVVDPVTGLALRARVFYMPDNSTVKVAIDALYGVKTLDSTRAVRVQMP